MIKKIVVPLMLLLIVSCKKEKAPTVSLQDDVYFLASDSLRGRETGTEYELKAAQYIMQRMKDLHLNPSGDSASYYQTFSFKPKRDLS